MHPQHHRRLLLTSHVLCDAWAFGRPVADTAELDKPSAFPFCTADLKRVLLPNLCVQGSQLTSREISLFLHDDVRPFTMEFVFKLSFECIHLLQPAALVSITQRISATMPYLETLRVERIPELGDHRTEVVADLPSSLRVLQLGSGAYPPKCFHEAHVQVLSMLPFLEELECEVDSSGLDVLLPLTLPAGDQSFPRLRSLAVMVQDDFQSNLELYQRVLQSPLVKQLRALDCSPSSVRIDSTAGSISLEPLAHIERLSSFLMNCNFSAATAPDFSRLQNCRDLGYGFFFGSELQGAVDLSGMQHLNRIGNHAFYCAKGATSIIFPPSLRFIGSRFCANSDITELDLAPLKSLEFVDTDHFFCNGSLQKFDTTPLLGAIGSRVGDWFLQCCLSLTEVDLSGLRGVKSIGDLFLGDCTALRNIRGCDGLSHVENIGWCFLTNTSSLEGCDFSQLVALRQCEHGLLAHSALEEKGKKIFVDIMEQNALAAAATPTPTSPRPGADSAASSHTGRRGRPANSSTITPAWTTLLHSAATAVAAPSTRTTSSSSIITLPPVAVTRGVVPPLFLRSQNHSRTAPTKM